MSPKIQVKKLPPYGKPLSDLVTSGQRPSNDVNLFIGNQAWAKGHSFSISYPPRTLILPPWRSPNTYHWPVTQCDVLIFDTGYADQSYIEELAYCLFQDGANVVRSISPHFILSAYKKDF